MKILQLARAGRNANTYCRSLASYQLCPKSQLQLLGYFKLQNWLMAFRPALASYNIFIQIPCWKIYLIPYTTKHSRGKLSRFINYVHYVGITFVVKNLRWVAALIKPTHASALYVTKFAISAMISTRMKQKFCLQLSRELSNQIH